MLRDGAEARHIASRTNLPTAKSSAEIARDIPARIRAQSFFSARVADARILDRFRSISDDYNSGRIGRDEARALMRTFARENGKDDGTASLKNLASTARLDLIVDQNAKMARAVGEYDRMYSQANMEAFPYVIYHASVGSKEPRSTHQRYDGMIFAKTDPWLRSHWPPWEFNCNCQLENCSAKRAGKEPARVQKPSPPEVAGRVDSQSGFSFDPKHAFEAFDLSGVRSPEQRGRIREDAEIEFGDQVKFQTINTEAEFEPKPYHDYVAETALKSAREWNSDRLPPLPAKQSPEAARKRLENGIEVQSAEGDKVVFGRKVLDHWKDKSQNEQDGRLARLEMGLDTVRNPAEIWKQETQYAYIQAFHAPDGKPKGCLVFVDKNGEAITYFPKDLKELDKARKGLSVKVLPASDAGRPAPERESPHPAPIPNQDKDTPNPENVKGKSQNNAVQPAQLAAAVGKRRMDFQKSLDSSDIVPVQKTALLDDYSPQAAREFDPPARVKLISPLAGNAGYNPQTDTLSLFKNMDAEDISHEMTHVWQYKAQKTTAGLEDEIRAAQKSDWERIQKRIKPEWLSFQTGEDRDRWAKALFGAKSYDDLSVDQRRTYVKLKDAIGSVSVGQVGGNHGATEEDNRAYFEHFDEFLPAQEALAQIRGESQYGFAKFGEIFPALKKVLEKHGLL